MRLKATRESACAAVTRAVSGLSVTDIPFGRMAALTLSGNQLTIVAQDNSTTASVMVEVDGGSDGSACIEHDALLGFLQRAVAHDVHFAVNGQALRLRSGGASLSLPLLTDSPAMVATPRSPSVEMAGEALATALRRVVEAVHEQSMPICGVHLCRESGHLLAEATDGRRFARASAAVELADLSVILSARFAQKLAEFAEREEAVAMRFRQDRIWVDTLHARLVGLVLEGKFPRLPSDGAKTLAWAELRLQQLREAVDLLRIFDEHAWITLQFGQGQLKLMTKAVRGHAEDSVECQRQEKAAIGIVALRDLRLACRSLNIETATISLVQRGDSTAIRLASNDGAVAWQIACRAD